MPLIGDLPAFRADRLGFLTRLAREQGDVAVFRIGPYRIWQLAHPDHVAGVLTGAPGRLRKGPMLQRARVVLGDGLLTAEAADHWTPGQPVDLHAEMVRTTLAVAGETLLGTDVHDDSAAVEAAIADLLSAYKLAFVPFGWRLASLPGGPMRRLRRGRATLHGLVERMVAARRAGGDGGDLLSALALDTSEDRLTDDELRDEAVTLLLAGHETTAAVPAGGAPRPALVASAPRRPTSAAARPADHPASARRPLAASCAPLT